MSSNIIILIIVSLISITTANEWTHSVWLDDKDDFPNNYKFHLNWKIDDQKQSITFLAQVKTRGWVGFGISPDGGIKNSDLVIGWVEDNGKTYFHDRFAKSESHFTIDESQDWKLLKSAQNESHTILHFSRPYKTCDNIYDIEISNQSVTHLIYIYGDVHPESVQSVLIPVHKGMKKFLPLEEDYEKAEPDDLEIYDFTHNTTMPTKASAYYCRVFKMDFLKPRHVIEYSAQLTPGNEKLIHHMIVYSCSHPDGSQFDKYLKLGSFDCTDFAKIPADFHYCLKGYWATAHGVDKVRTAPEAGYILGADEGTTYFFLQVHYENPKLIANRRDYSGIRTYHTGHVRPYDLAQMFIGVVVDYGVFIPPHQSYFKVSGHCSTECFKDIMPESGLHIIGFLPHAHVAVAMKMRHFRGDVELPFIFDDPKYDRSFTQFRRLKYPVIVKPGDILTTECFYNTSLVNETRLGGEHANQEMCGTQIVYYPRLKTYSQHCYSGITKSTFLSITGSQEIYGFGTSLDPVISFSFGSMRNMSFIKHLIGKQDWSPDIHQIYDTTEQRQQCYWIKEGNKTETQPDRLVSYPKNLKEYKPVEMKCQKPN